MFDEPWKLLLGLFTGIVFGFLLQKGRVAKYQVILGQLLLKDWTVLKIMGTAVLVGAVGVYVMLELGLVSLHIKPALLGGVIAGGVLFGIGMAVLGYCPGTSVAACGEGRRDAMVGVLGMLVGAGLFVASYASLQPLIHSLADWGKLTVPEALNVSPWLVIGVLLVTAALLVAFLERGGRGQRRRRTSFPLRPASSKAARRMP